MKFALVISENLRRREKTLTLCNGKNDPDIEITTNSLGTKTFCSLV